MKTTSQFRASVTLEDMIFENRNKAYGSFDLNRKFSKYLIIAFLISLAGVSSTLAIPFIKALQTKGSVYPDVRHIRVEMDKVRPLPEPPIPIPPPVPEKVIKEASYVAPRIVDEVPVGLDMETMGNLIEKAVSIPVLADIPVMGEPGGVIDEPPEEPYVNPQEHASFMNGDINEFRKWVQTRLAYPEDAIKLGVFGKVIVQFCVNEHGQIINVSIMRGADPLLDDESIRVISSSPLWKAARQGGRPVRQKFVIPVVFRLDN